MAKKVKLGDILQILTSQGFAYAQVIQKHPEFGFLIRTLSGFYNEQPKHFSAMLEGEPQFSALFVFQSAVNQDLLSVMANVPIPESLQVLPTLRSRNGGKGGSIWLWNGCEAVRLEREISSKELNILQEEL
ncbi:hypothetical protein [Pseudomonas syringae group genomosp. 3]|uniref:hypothetical protein n=1 Tax=Pseudomonas syringae group genomosp. 3 TaxID=251701 RepID=UPI00069B20B2|nr:hypothetical protein [Pseudomonas syringae group genomosp. 3]